MSNPVVIALTGVLAFVLAASSDWFEARYVRAIRAWEDGDRRARERAARSGTLMWVVGAITFYSVVEVGRWILIPEGLGVYAGTKLALR